MECKNLTCSLIEVEGFDNLDEVRGYIVKNVECLISMGIQLNDSVESIIEEQLLCPEEILLRADGYLMTGYIMSSIKSPQFYIFDMEGTTYKELLSAIESLSCGEIHIDGVSMMRDDSAEYGIKISFTCNRVQKSFIPMCDFDWLDVTIIGIVNEELKKNGSNKCICLGQSNQMCFITFQTEAWMNKLNSLLPVRLCKL